MTENKDLSQSPNIKKERSDSLEEISNFEKVPFSRGNGHNTIFWLDQETQEIWASAEVISQLYGLECNIITEQINKIYQEGELLEKATTRNFQVIQFENGKEINCEVINFNLDMILSIGYKVNSKQATEFRKWATNTLKAYLQQGYLINEKALRDSPSKLNKLAAKIRALRSEEKQIFAKVRECFKIGSSDYDPASQLVKTFYALLQDKFHYAITSMTSSKLIIDRANYKDSNMGLQTLKGEFPTLQEAQTGKNYLTEQEIYRLHLLSEQFLLYTEATAMSGRNMTMESLHEKLDNLLRLNEYPVFDSYKDFLKPQALEHAKIELDLYKKRKRIESLGIDYDEEALVVGEYDSLITEN